MRWWGKAARVQLMDMDPGRIVGVIRNIHEGPAWRDPIPHLLAGTESIVGFEGISTGVGWPFVGTCRCACLEEGLRIWPFVS